MWFARIETCISPEMSAGAAVGKRLRRAGRAGVQLLGLVTVMIGLKGALGGDPDVAGLLLREGCQLRSKFFKME